MHTLPQKAGTADHQRRADVLPVRFRCGRLGQCLLEFPSAVFLGDTMGNHWTIDPNG